MHNVIVVGTKIEKLVKFVLGHTNQYDELIVVVILEAALYSDRYREPVQMVTGTMGYRGRGIQVFAYRPVALLVILSILICLWGPQSADSVKRKHHWKADVIKNHLKNHKSLEGMIRLVDGQSEYDGTNTKIMK